MVTSESCPFCGIAHGDDASVEVICEGENWVAFFPDDPATLGHTLVIPRLHVPDVWSLPPALAGDLMRAVVKVGRAIMTSVEPEGMNLISSSGTAAEQTVFHLHLHVVPRWRADGIDPIWPPKQRMNERTKEGLADRIRSACVAETSLESVKQT